MWFRGPRGSRRLNEVRSRKERRHGHAHSDPVRARHASTKSAPLRSGDRHRCARPRPRRPASTKSAPQRSGDCRRRRVLPIRAGLNEIRSPKERRPHLRVQPFDMGRRDLRRALGSRGVRGAPCLSASAHKPWADKPFSDATARRIPDIDGALAKVPGSLQMMKSTGVCGPNKPCTRRLVEKQ